MSETGYVAADCLLVPKILFRDERYQRLSAAAKVLYSLLLDRLEYAAQNGWVDGRKGRYVIYPKRQMMRDLNSTRYRVDEAVAELEKMGDMVRVVRENGKQNRFYVTDVSGYGAEGKEMASMAELMERITPQERKEIMEKMAAAAGEIADSLAGKGYVGSLKEEPVMEKCCQEETEMIEEAAGEFGMDLAFGVMDTLGGEPGRAEAFRQYFNRMYEQKTPKKFMAVIETAAALCGNSSEWIRDMKSVGKSRRNIYLKELVSIFNLYLDAFQNREAE